MIHATYIWVLINTSMGAILECGYGSKVEMGGSTLVWRSNRLTFALYQSNCWNPMLRPRTLDSTIVFNVVAKSTSYYTGPTRQGPTLCCLSFSSSFLSRHGSHPYLLGSTLYYVRLLVPPRRSLRLSRPQLSQWWCLCQAILRHMVSRWDAMQSHALTSRAYMACQPWPRCLVEPPPMPHHPEGFVGILCLIQRGVAPRRRNVPSHL
jgi:hypothetical protein